MNGIDSARVIAKSKYSNLSKTGMFSASAESLTNSEADVLR